MHNTAVRFDELSLGYDGKPAVWGITGSFLPGSLTALVGPNGSGKSTLLKGIAGIVPPLSGHCRLKTGMRLAYLPQISEIDRSFPVCVHELVSLGLWQTRGLLGRHRAHDKQTLSDALDAVGLTGFDKAPLSALSGGQFQRALFARAMVQNADIILLDEPFNAVDAQTIQEMLQLIKRWHAENRTIVVAIHDPSLVLQHFPDTLMVNGAVVAWGKTKKVLPQNHTASPFCQHAWPAAGEAKI